MKERELSEHDERLEELFLTLNSPLDDGSFVTDVMRRVLRPMWVRRVTLIAAATVGFALSIVPISRTAIAISEMFLAATTRWTGVMRLEIFLVPAVVVLLAVSWPAALRWLSR